MPESAKQASSETVELEYFPSKTYRVYVGCGNIFITVCQVEGQIVRVILHRKSACICDISFFDALNRLCSFATNHDLEVVLEDLRGNDLPKDGHYCQQYSIAVKGKMKQGLLGAYSCADAVVKAIEAEIGGYNG